MEQKSIVDEIRTDWEQFKAENDKRLVEMKKFGDATAETSAKVDRINDALEARLDEIETRLNRPLTGGYGEGRPSDEKVAFYAKWLSAVQHKDVDAGQVDLKLIDRYNRSFVDWMRHGERAQSDSLRFLNEMSVGSAPDGGFWVSPDTTGRIVTLLTETSPIRQLADVQTISSDALEGTNDLDVQVAAWVGEAAVRAGNQNTADIGVWRIPAHEQYTEPNATQKLLDDSAVNVENWLAGKVASAFAVAENTAFVTGDGALKPRGFTTYPEGVPVFGAWAQVEWVHSGAAATLTGDGLINLVFALKSAYHPGAVFGMRRATMRVVRTLKDGVGNYLWQPDFSARPAGTLLGYGLVEMADMALLGAGSRSVVFGNFRAAYQIVDRLGVRVLRDPYTRKGFVKFYTTKRVGGDLVNFEAIKLQETAV